MARLLDRFRYTPPSAGLTKCDIVNGYVWLLGRKPSRGEVVASLAHFASYGDGALLAFQNGLIISEEFRARRIGATQTMRVEPVDLFRPKIALLHIEKCGGTSLRTMLVAHRPACRVCPEAFNGLTDWTASELAAYDLFAGHFDLTVCQILPGPTRIVTMLREPKARLLSLFNFWKAHRPQPAFNDRTLVGLAQRHTAAAFFSHPAVIEHPSIRDAIVGQLTRRVPSPILADGFQRLLPDDPILAEPTRALDDAWHALKNLAGFGLVEAFEASRLLLNHQLGLAMQPAPPQQALQTLTSPMLDENRLTPEKLTPTLAALLEGLTPLDRALYTQAASLFTQRTAALINDSGA